MRLLAAIGPILLLGPGCGRPGGEPALSAATANTPAIARVVTVAPERRAMRRLSEQPGQIEAVEVTPIHAKVSGYVASVAVDIGDRLKKGQLMAEIRVPEIEADLKQKRALVQESEAEVKQAEAAVGVALAGVEAAEAKAMEMQAGVRRAESEVARWHAEFARVEQLAQERALTGTLLDETRSKLEAAEAGRDEVKAKVRSSVAAVAEAKALLEKARADARSAATHVEVARFEAERAQAMETYTRIVAPYDGVVTRRRTDTGQLTTPGSAAEPLFIVARTGIATISVGVPEADAPRVEVGDEAVIRLLALEDRKFQGKVTRTSWALEPSTRTLAAEIDIPDPEGVLRPGLYAYATIVVEEHKAALTVPATSVVKEGGKAYCVTVADRKAARREVKTGLNDGKRVEILSGLGEGDRVVEANAASLADGQPVEVAEPPAAASSRPKT
ncbi:efflux RND transporter periplasmic adaptor subunit [Aquisphaera giovannonii]|nr:efflux RND transporter periplasmic adaptor subunit [Aquisphaera giovannonii]